MSASNLSRIVACTILVLGTAVLVGRYQSRIEVNQAVEDSLWRLTYDVRFTVAEDNVELRLAIPQSGFPSTATVQNEEFVHTGLERSIVMGQQTGTRRLILRPPYQSDFEVKAEFDIRISPRRWSTLRKSPTALASDAKALFLRSEEQFPTRHSLVQQVLSQAPKELTQGELLEWLFGYCSQNIRSTTSEEGGDDVLMVLAPNFGKATPLGRARLLVTLCREAGLPARLVTGFEMRQSRVAQPHVWVEVFRGHHWVPFDPEYGYARSMPSSFLPIRRGDVGLVTARSGIEIQSAIYSIIRLPPAEDVLRAEVRHPSQIFDLTNLPVDMHEVMSLMLLLPLGALITAVFRNLVGIQTFGTFAPALLALSFIYADWITGLLILTVVMAAGVAGRSLLERLHLLMVPRLSIILTVIILCVLFGVSFLDYMEVTPSAQAVLLPLVILTILIERMYVVSEEDGAAFTLQLALGTIVVAACCYLLLRWDEVGRIMLVYPELHCFTLAAFIGIGRYTGYRLTELWRFRDLANTDETV